MERTGMIDLPVLMFCGWAKVALGGAKAAAPESEKLQLGQELQGRGIKGRRLSVY